MVFRLGENAVKIAVIGSGVGALTNVETKEIFSNGRLLTRIVTVAPYAALIGKGADGTSRLTVITQLELIDLPGTHSVARAILQALQAAPITRKKLARFKLRPPTDSPN